MKIGDRVRFKASAYSPKGLEGVVLEVLNLGFASLGYTGTLKICWVWVKEDGQAASYVGDFSSDELEEIRISYWDRLA